MKQALTYISFMDILFILFLALSGMFGGAFYYLAFLVPFAVAFFLKDKVKTDFPKIKISKENLLLTLPTIAPTLALIFLISLLTSLLLSFAGEGTAPDVSGNLILVILRYAVVTVLLEEALFRYIPLAFLAPYTRRGAIIISSILFALSHCNLYQIPYAFFAGVVFAALDVAFESILPSVTIHFLNNLLSVIWLRNGESINFEATYVSILVASAVLSLIFLIIFRKKYKEKILPVIADKSKYELSYGVVIFAVMTLIIAITNIIGGI